jgi:hypothetical protein
MGESPKLDFSPWPSAGLSCRCYNKLGGSILNGHYWSHIAFPLPAFGPAILARHAWAHAIYLGPDMKIRVFAPINQCFPYFNLFILFGLLGTSIHQEYYIDST